MLDIIGKFIGRYQIIEKIGEGGMATVYKGYDSRLECNVAIKVIRIEKLAPEILEVTLKRFEKEAKNVSKLLHPNIVQITDYGDYEGIPYLVMPFVPGGTLKQHLGKFMEYQKAVKLLIPIAEALNYAHSHSIIHRDVKPSNILITETGQPMLSDFGVAKLLEIPDTMTLTATGIGIGTPEYMAPEQWTGKCSMASDCYSLGVLFYELITGQKPYTADTPAGILIKSINDPLPRPSLINPNLPENVERFLTKALAKKVEDRFQNTDDFIKEFSSLLTESHQTEFFSSKTGQTDDIFENTQVQYHPQEQGTNNRKVNLSQKQNEKTIKPPNIIFLSKKYLPLSILLLTMLVAAIVIGTLKFLDKKNDQTEFISVSNLTGNITYQIPGAEPAFLKKGDLLATGQGSVVSTGNSYLEILLPDSTTIVLDRFSSLELVSLDLSPEFTLPNLVLQYGKMILQTGDETGLNLEVAVPTGAFASVKGSIMGVAYEPNDQQLIVDCIEGYCQITGTNNESLELEAVASAFLYTSGSPQQKEFDGIENWNRILTNIDTSKIVINEQPETNNPAIVFLPTFTIAPTVFVQTIIPPTFTPQKSPLVFTKTPMVLFPSKTNLVNYTATIGASSTLPPTQTASYTPLPTLTFTPIFTITSSPTFTPLPTNTLKPPATSTPIPLHPDLSVSDSYIEGQKIICSVTNVGNEISESTELHANYLQWDEVSWNFLEAHWSVGQLSPGQSSSSEDLTSRPAKDLKCWVDSVPGEINSSNNCSGSGC